MLTFQLLEISLKKQHPASNENQSTTPIVPHAATAAVAPSSATNQHSNELPPAVNTTPANNQRTNQPPPAANTTVNPAYKRKKANEKYEIGHTVNFYDTEIDGLSRGTIIQKINENVYRVGSNGKVIFLNKSYLSPTV